MFWNNFVLRKNPMMLSSQKLLGPLAGTNNFRFGCTPFLQRFFADSYGSASLFFYFNLLPASKMSVWFGKRML